MNSVSVPTKEPTTTGNVSNLFTRRRNYARTHIFRTTHTAVQQYTVVVLIVGHQVGFLSSYFRILVFPASRKALSCCTAATDNVGTQLPPLLLRITAVAF